MNTKNNDALIYIIAIGVAFVVLVTFAIIMFTATSSDVTTEQNFEEIDGFGSADDSTAEAAPSNTVPTDTSESAVSDAPEPVTETPTPSTEAPVTVTVPDDWDVNLAETPDAGQEYIDKLVFLGDSTTYGLRHYSMLSGGKDTLQVWTPRSGTLTLSNVSFATIVYPETDTEITIKEALTAKQPEILVITLGVNGVSILKEDQFKSFYTWLIDAVREVSPETKIICQTIFPVGRNYASLGSINNEKITAANEWIYEVATEKGVKFIDTYSVLADSEGWLPDEYQNGDGLHLNPDGFTIELDNLRTHAYID